MVLANPTDECTCTGDYTEDALATQLLHVHRQSHRRWLNHMCSTADAVTQEMAEIICAALQRQPHRRWLKSCVQHCTGSHTGMALIICAALHRQSHRRWLNHMCSTAEGSPEHSTVPPGRT